MTVEDQPRLSLPAASTRPDAALDGTALADDFVRINTTRPRGRVLISGGTIISMDPAIGDFIRGDVLVEDGRIAAVGPSIQADDATLIDASKTIVMPGLVDAHRHLWSALFRRTIADADGADYSRFANTLIPHVRPQDVYISTLMCSLSCLHSGITTMLDFSHITKSAEIADAAVEAHFQSGLRAVYAPARPRTGPAEPPFPDDVERIVGRYFSSRDQLVTCRFAAPLESEYYAAGRRLGLGITSDGIFGISTPLRPLSRAETILAMGAAGELGEDVTLIHGTGFAPDVFQVLADNGVSLVLAPTSDSTLRGLGDSIPPIQGAMDFDLLDRTGISIDIEISLNSDLFAQMRAIFTIQRLLSNADWARGAAPAKSTLSVREVLKMATIGGARTCGLADVAGSLTPGKEADIVLLRTDGINDGPLNNAVGHIVIGAGVENVDTVLVGGRLRKWKGKLVGVDIDAVMAQATAARDHLAHVSGLWSPQDIVA